MRGIYVTGTDTGAGKTIVSGLLGRYISEKGYSVITQKWIQTGSKGFPEDIDTHLRLMGRRRRDVAGYSDYISSYNLGFPSSPHLAAGLEGKRIEAGKIKKAYRYLSKRFDFIIAEGVGGALVPYDTKRLVIDIARELKMRALVVADNKLGAINHTLLTVEALRKRDIKMIGIIFNGTSGRKDDAVMKDNPRIVRKLTGENVLGALPHLHDRGRLYNAFKPIAKKIIKAL